MTYKQQLTMMMKGLSKLRTKISRMVTLQQTPTDDIDILVVIDNVEYFLYPTPTVIEGLQSLVAKSIEEYDALPADLKDQEVSNDVLN